MLHFNIIVRGKVQGVFFRASAKEKALSLGLFGFVRNEPDESVYLEVEGEAPALQIFVEWCNQGPAGSSVTNVSTSSGPPRNFTDFRISR